MTARCIHCTAVADKHLHGQILLQMHLLMLLCTSLSVLMQVNLLLPAVVMICKLFRMVAAAEYPLLPCTGISAYWGWSFSAGCTCWLLLLLLLQAVLLLLLYARTSKQQFSTAFQVLLHRLLGMQTACANTGSCNIRQLWLL